jgi:hypothetical protein
MRFLEDLWNQIVNIFGGETEDNFPQSEQARVDTRYAGHEEAVIVACYFNPTKSPARRRTFDRFYQSIKHLNHRVVECVIGEEGIAELPENENISRIYTRDVLWHKESLINRAILQLPEQFRYVFWIDADVLFTNRNWLIEAVSRLASDVVIVQPFEFAVHLEENEAEQPSFDLDNFKAILRDANALRNGKQQRHKRVWRSIAANWETCRDLADSTVYDEHGHVGFAWGARRELLETVPLYDRALVGGADHIIAHAAAGQIPSHCIDKSFTADLEEVYEWSRRFANETRGQLAFITGDVYHLWHGDLKKRDYLNRIREFTPIAREVRQRDDSGLYTTDDGRITGYVENYLHNREVNPHDDSFGQTTLDVTESLPSNQAHDVSPVVSHETMPTVETDAPWTGFGGGGDFAGGGAGGDWSSANVSSSLDAPSTAFTGVSESDLTSGANNNFS